MAKYDTWVKEKDLENSKNIVAKFKERLSAKVRKQDKLDMICQSCEW